MPMIVTPSGMVIFVSHVQLENVALLIVVIPLGMLIFVSLLQQLKALKIGRAHV